MSGAPGGTVTVSPVLPRKGPSVAAVAVTMAGLYVSVNSNAPRFVMPLMPTSSVNVSPAVTVRDAGRIYTSTGDEAPRRGGAVSGPTSPLAHSGAPPFKMTRAPVMSNSASPQASSSWYRFIAYPVLHVGAGLRPAPYVSS